jgi:hypothetical protein
VGCRMDMYMHIEIEIVNVKMENKFLSFIIELSLNVFSRVVGYCSVWVRGRLAQFGD